MLGKDEKGRCVQQTVPQWQVRYILLKRMQCLPSQMVHGPQR